MTIEGPEDVGGFGPGGGAGCKGAVAGKELIAKLNGNVTDEPGDTKGISSVGICSCPTTGANGNWLKSSDC